jgi:enamine deaminase RidA (YjgF/YER057c/UK114 family)
MQVPILDRLTTVPDVATGPGFAHAVTTSGKLAFVAGQVALNAAGQLVGAGDLAAQTAQALRNLQGVLRALGADWPDVARFSWYLLDAGAVQTIRDVRDEIIRPSLGNRSNPASTLVQVAALVRAEFLVEVEAVVALPG